MLDKLNINIDKLSIKKDGNEKIFESIQNIALNKTTALLQYM